MSKPIQIFVGVVPSELYDHDFDMIIADTKNQTQQVYDLSIGDNARVITINENTVIAFARKTKVERVQQEAKVLSFDQAKNFAIDDKNA